MNLTVASFFFPESCSVRAGGVPRRAAEEGRAGDTLSTGNNSPT